MLMRMSPMANQSAPTVVIEPFVATTLSCELWASSVAPASSASPSDTTSTPGAPDSSADSVVASFSSRTVSVAGSIDSTTSSVIGSSPGFAASPDWDSSTSTTGSASELATSSVTTGALSSASTASIASASACAGQLPSTITTDNNRLSAQRAPQYFRMSLPPNLGAYISTPMLSSSRTSNRDRRLPVASICFQLVPVGAN